MPSKKYKIKPTPKQRKLIKKYWAEFCRVHDHFYGDVQMIERAMELETGIKGIEFFRDNMVGDWAGVGTSGRDMKLIQLDPV